MAKEMGYFSSWNEVAPALLVSPTKVPISPVLETITEEEAEEYDEDSQTLEFAFVVSISVYCAELRIVN